MEKNLDENDGEGNSIWALETLHQGNSRQHSSCKDDIDRLEIPLFPLLSIGPLRLQESRNHFCQESKKELFFLLPGSVHLIATILSAAKVILWIYLPASLQTLMSGMYLPISWTIETVTNPNPEAHDAENANEGNPYLF